MMKHIQGPRLRIENPFRHYYTNTEPVSGYCKEADGYVMKLPGVFCDEMYYNITSEENDLIRLHRKALAFDSDEILLRKLVPRYWERMIGAAGERLHLLKSWPDGFRPYICQHGPYLLEDGFFYWHLFWEGVHYAAVPHFLAPYTIQDLNPTIPYRVIEGLDLCWVDFNDERVLLCYGKKVDEFEGMEEWQELYKLWTADCFAK